MMSRVGACCMMGFLLPYIINMADGRPFVVALTFGIFWIFLAYLGGFLLIPEWNRINMGLCLLGVFVAGINYYNEYLGKFPLSYR